MKKEALKKTERKLRDLRNELSEIGNMRPGTLSIQYRKPEEQKYAFHQLSYTFKGKSRSEYVRAENVEAVKCELNAFKKFKALSEEIVELSIEASRIRFKREK